MAESLVTTNKLQELQKKLHLKAKSEPKFRFYALYDKIYRYDVLIEAWRRVRSNGGAAGIDGQSIEDVETAGVEEFLKKIQEELKTETYKPQPARRVEIPKAGGGKRELGIPTVRERVVQQALKLIIEPIFEADFEDSSYGYRPKRSTQQAAEEVCKYLNYGLTQVIDADIEDCFGSIPHGELVEMIAGRIADGKVIRLIKLFLEAGVMKDGGIEKDDTGTPQGGVISPLFANIYLDKIDKGWKPLTGITRIIRYADDLIIMTKYDIDKRLEKLQKLTGELKLRLSKKKTRIVNAEEESFDFLGYSFKKALNKTGTKKVAYYWPSEKSTNKIRAKVKAITNPAKPVEVKQVVEELRPVLRGWVNNFRTGNSSKKFGIVKRYTASRVRKFMSRRRDKAGYNYKEYTDEYLYSELGLYNDYKIRWMKTLRRAVV